MVLTGIARTADGGNTMSLLVLLLILIVLFGGVGYYGHGAGWGPYGWSPVGLLVIILIVLLLTGRLG